MHVMLSCGEPSGDLYAGAVTAALRDADPAVRVSGLGGDRLAAAGAELVRHFSGISVTGLQEVLRVLPRTYATYRALIRHAAATRPDVFVAVDFPDFNFRLAGALHRLGIPVVYYISPQLWAWRPGRMRTMRTVADRVLVIFPFEEAIYRAAGVPVEWVGHPLLDVTAPLPARAALLRAAGLDPARPVVALLPGSRANEVRAILPGLATAAAQVRAAVPDVQFLVPQAPHVDRALLSPLEALRRQGAPLAVLDGQADAVLAAADVAAVAPGTVTVQAALQECPMVVVYRLSPLTYRLGRRFVRVDTFAMANLVAGRRVVPELIQDDFTPAAVAAHVVRLLRDPQERDAMRAELRAVRAKLGAPGASARAARSILEVARRGAAAPHGG
jgi:lipid-A-disaccharide synthase